MRLALDWGRARVGVAACDPDGVLAYPVETLDARNNPLGRLSALVAEYEPVEVVFGWPRNLAGKEGPAVDNLRGVLAEVEDALDPVPVVLVDERMSTAEASRKLAEAGKDSRARRGIIDQMAAVGILEQALERRRQQKGNNA
ncbi:Holliday junction resolvase RuvX [Aestuariimicrobium sp. p3-SID1156]|uniref:Holliday junction resolvase RuvX n=1 Tax=Aestuariimicrobium sp. p3-SID1156 TaxID=2916038 RepID=UPI00223B8F61|nr:Holliday junction resolvase RuvX [Aestuariimicrobium sp. p3-SID1156]MCT1459517.1 Holliday junction resolvase RuvX [Aestuariimicrobium sp. p3-SID1156]